MSIKIRSPFDQLFWIVIGMLLVGVFFLDILIGVQGLRIRSVSVDTAAATKDRNQKIVLAFNQPVQSISNDQVTITPAASFTILAKGDSAVIQLKERLDYDTHYEVKLSKLHAANGKESKNELKHTFFTPANFFYHLKRNYFSKRAGSFTVAKQDDEIFKSDLGGQSEAVFTAPSIQEYCLLKDDLIVATLGDDDTNRLFRIHLDTSKKEELPLPEVSGDIALLRCSPTKNTYGYTFTSNNLEKATYNSILFTGQLTNIPPKSEVVAGIDKKPLRVSDWSFAPDGTSILAYSYDAGVLLIDGLKLHNTLPLGTFYDIGGFNFDGQSFVASDTTGLFMLNIPKYSKTLISPQLEETQPTSAYPLQNSDGRIERTVISSSDSLNLRVGNEVKFLYRADEGTNILSYMTSPNDQYLVVTLSKSAEIEFSLYPRRPMTKDTRTLIIDMATLKTVKTIDGFDVTWP